MDEKQKLIALLQDYKKALAARQKIKRELQFFQKKHDKLEKEAEQLNKAIKKYSSDLSVVSTKIEQAESAAKISLSNILQDEKLEDILGLMQSYDNYQVPLTETVATIDQLDLSEKDLKIFLEQSVSVLSSESAKGQVSYIIHRFEDAGIKIGHVIQITEADLLSLNGVAQKSVDALKRALIGLHPLLTLGMKLDEDSEKKYNWEDVRSKIQFM